MSNNIVQLTDYNDNNIYPIAGAAAEGSITKTMLDEGVFVGAELSDPGNTAYVGTADIQDSAVTTAKIANLNVTTAKLATGAVTSDKVDSSITKVLSTVADLAANAGTNGIYRTKGYYSEGDGGGALYLVNTSSSGVNEIDHITCQDGHYAHLMDIGYSHAKQYGAKGDGIHDDYSNLMRAINAHDITYIPQGVYLVSDTLDFENKTIQGSNYTHVTIKGNISDNTKPIIGCGGSCHIDGICVAYDSSVITSNIAKGKYVGIRLYGGYRNLAMQQGSITNCQCNYCGSGIWDGDHSVFSCHFDTIKMNNVGRWGLAMTSSKRTGNVYTNIYVNNSAFISPGHADTVQCNQGFYLDGEESECVIDQLNVEHLTAYQPIQMKNVHAAHVGSIHLEGVRCINTYDGFLSLDRFYGTIDCISFYYTRHKTGQYLIKLLSANGTDTSTDLFGGEKCLTINNIELKGLNRPDRDTYGYDPEYPVSASTLAGSLGAGYLIARETASDKYLVDIRSINWQTFTYGFDDSSAYEDYPKNNHDSILFLNYGAKAPFYTTADRPTKMLFDGLKIYDATLHKTITRYGSNWYDEDGNTV